MDDTPNHPTTSSTSPPKVVFPLKSRLIIPCFSKEKNYRHASYEPKKSKKYSIIRHDLRHKVDQITPYYLVTFVTF